jgi:hypothetical protein
MIFKKILKGTDLTIDISLEKTQYRPGDIVRGRLSIKTEKGSKARRLMLLAEGKESTIIRVSENRRVGSNRDTATKTYSEVNVFFSKDLSKLLEESVFRSVLQDGSLEISPQNKVIAFDFTLPADNNTMFSTYKGKHANITYSVKATADIAKKMDVNKEEQFSVINSNSKMVLYSNKTSFADNNNNKNNTESDIINTTAFENQKDISPSPIIEAEEKDAGKENYEARIEQIFGEKANNTLPKNRLRYFTLTGTTMNFDLGTIFAKGREHFLKESSEARIDLIDHDASNTPYSPGHTVKGKVILLLPPNQEKEEEEEKRKKIREMKVTLNGIEHAFAQGLQRVSTIEKYEKNIELNRNENLANTDNNAIPFELEIPQGINQSYRAKYSEYFWGLEAKVNIAWSSDINARTIIEIV